MLTNTQSVRFRAIIRKGQSSIEMRRVWVYRALAIACRHDPFSEAGPAMCLLGKSFILFRPNSWIMFDDCRLIFLLFFHIGSRHIRMHHDAPSTRTYTPANKSYSEPPFSNLKHPSYVDSLIQPLNLNSTDTDIKVGWRDPHEAHEWELRYIRSPEIHTA